MSSKEAKDLNKNLSLKEKKNQDLSFEQKELIFYIGNKEINLDNINSKIKFYKTLYVSLFSITTSMLAILLAIIIGIIL